MPTSPPGAPPRWGPDRTRSVTTLRFGGQAGTARTLTLQYTMNLHLLMLDHSIDTGLLGRVRTPSGPPRTCLSSSPLP